MKLMKVNCTGFSEENFEELDNIILEAGFENVGYEIDIENKNVHFFLTKEKVDGDVTFHDFIEQGKLMKSFLITNSLITDSKDNSRFSIITIEDNVDNKKSSNEELDKLIYKVPKDDNKLVDVLGKLKTITTKSK